MKHYILKLLLFSLRMHRIKALNVGKRRILCTRPADGLATDALMDPKPTIPLLIGYVGIQAVLPSFSQCPVASQIQPPWFKGEGGAGFCPPEFWNFGALVPGLLFFGVALAINSYAESNRLLVDGDGIGIVGVVSEDGDRRKISKDSADMIPFGEIEDRTMTPLGLIVKRSGGSGTTFFPALWHSQSVDALLDDRM
eukprot:CAMPEP_0194332472 /NCGR_PEP_ID=MMETSP0171-20130528/59248_1 /TAXON_ID=218684 /ORGANISM="Corethron pennatum, Strain L29A3" /LENGTH=195 /DNA_ID=CAMNT_0039094343 /DNA_START=66 /DNA_END=653 /DNA_ORIENTATION=+